MYTPNIHRGSNSHCKTSLRGVCVISNIHLLKGVDLLGINPRILLFSSSVEPHLKRQRPSLKLMLHHQVSGSCLEGQVCTTALHSSRKWRMLSHRGRSRRLRRLLGDCG